MNKINPSLYKIYLIKGSNHILYNKSTKNELERGFALKCVVKKLARAKEKESQKKCPKKISQRDMDNDVSPEIHIIIIIHFFGQFKHSKLFIPQNVIK